MPTLSRRTTRAAEQRQRGEAALLAAAEALVAEGTPFGELGIDVVGYVVPGLLAIWMDRQGVVVTVTSAVTASIATRLAGLLWMVN